MRALYKRSNTIYNIISDFHMCGDNYFVFVVINRPVMGYNLNMVIFVVSCIAFFLSVIEDRCACRHSGE